MLKLFNTMTRKKETVKTDGTVKMYFCGPTVYDYAHIGNFRAYVFCDLLRRCLEYLGLKVKLVMNITDVDDKTIRNSRQQNMRLKEFTGKYEKAFFEDLGKLRIKKAGAYPRATEHISEMVSLINELLRKGIAYKGEDGSIYYDILKFKRYGKLSKLDIKGLKAGARVKQDEYTKEQVQDFALWKAHMPEDGDVFWTPDFGGVKIKGRPGWHIECSAMSAKHLGKVDIHGGGIDLVFPHHENEIAQSEPVFGRLVKHWAHNEHLLVDGKKMSKSLGNFYTLRDLLAKGHDPVAIRYLLLSSHYRGPLNFTLESLEKAKETIDAVNDFAGRLEFLKNRVDAKENKPLQKEIASAEKEFTKQMSDDLNVPEALAAIFGMISKVNAAIDANDADCKSIESASGMLAKINAILGILSEERLSLAKEEKELIERREQLRSEKKFAEADTIRAELKAKGILLEDTPYGARAKRSRAASIMEMKK